MCTTAVDIHSWDVGTSQRTSTYCGVQLATDTHIYHFAPYKYPCGLCVESTVKRVHIVDSCLMSTGSSGGNDAMCRYPTNSESAALREKERRHSRSNPCAETYDWNIGSVIHLVRLRHPLTLSVHRLCTVLASVATFSSFISLKRNRSPHHEFRFSSAAGQQT